MRKVYDLSHKIENGMTIYPGDPLPSIVPGVAGDSSWKVSELHLGTHSGTHIDAASHYIPAGNTIDQYPVDRFILPGVIAPALGLKDDQPIEIRLIQETLSILPKGGAFIVRTDWDRFWGTERFLHHPYLTPEVVKEIIDAGASLVGIDALNVDSTAKETVHAHELLLGKDILIVENIANLDQLSYNKIYTFAFLPLLLPLLDGSPVRAVAWANV